VDTDADAILCFARGTAMSRRGVQSKIHISHPPPAPPDPIKVGATEHYMDAYDDVFDPPERWCPRCERRMGRMGCSWCGWSKDRGHE
jgi:hypothetical protein